VLRRVEGERSNQIGLSRVADEATSGMSVKTDHEEEGKVVGVPERLEALRADLLVGGGVHEDHDKEHEMTSETTRLGVVNLLGKLLTNFYSIIISGRQL
jgi:hypothetical protein